MQMEGGTESERGGEKKPEGEREREVVYVSVLLGNVFH